MAEQTTNIPFEDSQENLLAHLTKLIHLNKHYGFYQLCPKCDGQKKVLYPPYLPAGVESFSSSQTEWPCDVCKGEGILIRPEINPTMITEETKARIAQQAAIAYNDSPFVGSENYVTGYIAGAEAEAERAARLVECLNSVKAIGYPDKRVLNLITETLAEYNNTK